MGVPASGESHRSRRHRHKQRGKGPEGSVKTAQPVQASASAGPLEFDVELIPLSEAAELGGKKSLWSNLAPSGLRDWVLVGYGAGTILFLVAFVWFLIAIFGGSAEAVPGE